jgi:phage terminase small subunit
MSQANELSGSYQRLKRRHRRFVDEYLTGKKGTEAMKAIGFKGRRPEIAASKLLARPEVRAAVEERRAVLCEAVGLRQESILAEMMKIAFGRDRADKVRALTELAEIIGLKKTAAVQQALGPGLQVIIQQQVVQGAGGQASGPALGVVVNLPGPG